MDNPTSSNPTPQQAPIYISFTVNFSAWLIAEASLKYVGTKPHPTKRGSMCFVFEDPQGRGAKLLEDFNRGCVYGNVVHFVNARYMLIETVRGGNHENSR